MSCSRCEAVREVRPDAVCVEHWRPIQAVSRPVSSESLVLDVGSPRQRALVAATRTVGELERVGDGPAALALAQALLEWRREWE